MPRGKRDVPFENSPRGSHHTDTEPKSLGWGGFVNVKLTDAQKEDFKGWLEGDGAGFWANLCDVISEGFKYSLAWDDENEAFVATLTGQGVVGSEDRYCLTARGGTMESATALLVFKDQVLLGKDWGRYRPRTGAAEVD